MEFKNIFLGFVGIIGLIFWIISYFNLFKTPMLHVHSSENKSKSWQSKFKTLAGLIGITGWLSLSFSLMGPRLPMKLEKSQIEVNDIFFVVDVSRSMLAEDFKPNRLEAAKSKIAEFIKLRPKDRIGIIIFAEKIFTLLPLTTDLNLINRIIDQINTGFLGAGTNIGDALGLAVARAARSEAKNKVVILLTDGVSNVGNLTPLQAAEQAKKLEVKVYTIGIGGDVDAKLPVKGFFGSKRYQNIPGGSNDPHTLQKIADITGGKMYIVNNDQALRDVLSEIEKLERTKIDANAQIVYDEKFFPYLLFGILLLLFSEFSRKFILREVI